MARVPAEDGATMPLLTSMERNAIGAGGEVTAGADGELVFSAG